MNWLEFANSAIRVPFCERGRTYRGWDCYGLIVCGYRDVLDIYLPMYSEAYEDTNDYYAMARCINANKQHWIQRERQLGSLALIRRRGYLIHLGIVITDIEILHCDRGAGTVIEQDDRMNVDSYWQHWQHPTQVDS